MNTITKEMGISDYLDALKRRSRLMYWVSGLVIVVTVLLALFLPPIYRSHAIILIEQQEIPSDLVRSTVTSFAEQRIQVISQRVMTSSNLFEIIEKYDLYSDERKREPREVIIESMRDDIGRETISAEVVDPRSGRPTNATIAFRLQFDSRSPALAQKVVNELVSLYLNENIKSRTEAAAETATFLSEEAGKYRKRVADIEQELAAFKEQNVHSRPELERVTRDAMNRLEIEISEIDRRLHAAKQQQILYAGELAQIEPYREEESRGEISAMDRLRAIEAQLVAAEAAYGSRHPDVLRLRKQADAVRQEVAPESAREVYEEQLDAARIQLAEQLEKYDASHPDTQKTQRQVDTLLAKLDALPAAVAEKAPNNPTYIGLRARIESFDSDIRSLETQREVLREKLAGYASSLMQMPDVEAQYRAINREYESAVVKFREITAKQMEAGMSESLESERKGEKFTLIEPPFVPEQPKKPNRTTIFLFGLVLAFFGGFGSVAVAEALDNKVRGRAGIQSLLSAPPLASIPYVLGDEKIRSRKRVYATVAGVLVLLAVIALAIIHFTYKPLDVLWFVLLRKFGI